jgi:uncharacterized membrane protein
MWAAGEDRRPADEEDGSMGSNSASGQTKDSAQVRRWYPWSGERDLTHPIIRAAHDDRTFGERVADGVARFGGSWPFIFLFLGMIAAWMVVNTLLLARVVHHQQFDPYPYIALNLALSAMAGLQAPIIMMSQNRAAARDEALAGHHYQESQKMEDILVATRELLQGNTDLTEKVHVLTQQIHELVAGEGAKAAP